MHGLQPQRQASRGCRGDDQPAANGEAQFGGGGAPFRRGGHHGRYRNRGAGFPADLRLHDGAILAGAHRPRNSRARTIKLEDPPTPFKTSRILEASKDIQVRIFGGLGGVFLLEELMAGATGAMTGFAYPEILVEIVNAFRAGDRRSRGGFFLLQRAADAIRVSGRHRHGDPQRSAAAARSDYPARRFVRPAQSWTRPRLALDRVLNWTREPHRGAIENGNSRLGAAGRGLFARVPLKDFGVTHGFGFDQ